MPMVNIGLGAHRVERRGVNECDPVVQLAVSVILCAYKDTKSKDPAKSKAACDWFEKREYGTWADLLKLDPDLIYEGYQRVQTLTYYEAFGRYQRKMKRR